MAEQTNESKPTSPVATPSGQASAPAPAKRPKSAMWIIAGIGVALVGLLVFSGSGKNDGAQSPAAVGSTVSGDLTLQTADRNELDCLAPKGIQSFECGAVDEKQTRQIDEAKKLRPFMTTDRQLYLIPGLFVEPALAQRYNAEPPNKPRDQLKRFTAKCKLKVIGELDEVKLRWSQDGAWEPPKKFPVATASECSIEG